MASIHCRAALGAQAQHVPFEGLQRLHAGSVLPLPGPPPCAENWAPGRWDRSPHVPGSVQRPDQVLWVLLRPPEDAPVPPPPDILVLERDRALRNHKVPAVFQANAERPDTLSDREEAARDHKDHENVHDSRVPADAHHKEGLRGIRGVLGPREGHRRPCGSPPVPGQV